MRDTGRNPILQRKHHRQIYLSNGLEKINRSEGAMVKSVFCSLVSCSYHTYEELADLIRTLNENGITLDEGSKMKCKPKN